MGRGVVGVGFEEREREKRERQPDARQLFLSFLLFNCDFIIARQPTMRES
jgi:hypothetical protein